MTPRVVERRIDYSSRWLDVVVKDVDLDGPRGREQFWAVRTLDYAAVVAVTGDGRIPLVRQFRPALEAYALELPSGTIERGEEPEAAVRRELLEETGFEAAEVRLAGKLAVDSGRMETAQWAFFAPGVQRVAEPSTDEPLEVLFATPAELRRLIERGEFAMSVHVASVLLVVVRGWLEL